VQHAMSTRHGEYSAAMRLGRSLKDRCTKADPEKDVLAGMLDQLKIKWNSLRSGATQRYTTLYSGEFYKDIEGLIKIFN